MVLYTYLCIDHIENNLKTKSMNLDILINVQNLLQRPKNMNIDNIKPLPTFNFLPYIILS